MRQNLTIYKNYNVISQWMQPLALLLGVFLIVPLCFGQTEEPATAQPTTPAVVQTVKSGEASNINIDVKNMNILDVLRLLADQGQVNIVASHSVQGRITAKLQNVSIKEALDAILDTNNLVYKFENGIIKVFSPQDLMQQEQTEILHNRVFVLKNIKAQDMRQILNSIKSARGRVEINTVTNQVVVTDTLDVIKDVEKMLNDLDQELVTKVYRLNYANATELQAKLLELIPKQEGDVFIDERTNSLVVRAVASSMEKVEKIIQNWDQRSLQVQIEAKIFEVNRDKSKGLGVNWEYKQKEGKNAIDVSSTVPFTVSTGGILKVGTLSEDEYTATVQALETSTNTNILSSPRIVVANKKEANILVGSSEPYQVVTINNDTKTQTQETRFMDVGVKLVVTPQISDDDYITLKIHPEVSSARRVAEVNNALAVDTTQADTTVVLRDGRTIVLGGLIKDTDTKIVNKIPILGDVPLLGLLFRSQGTTKVKREVIVFITPHILRGDGTPKDALKSQDPRDQAMKHALEEAGDKWKVWEEREHENSH